MSNSEEPWSFDETLADGQGDSSSSTCTLEPSNSACIVEHSKALQSLVFPSAGRSTPTSSRAASVPRLEVAGKITDFRRKTMDRVLAHAKLVRKKREDRHAQPKKFAHIDVEGFRRDIQKWVNTRQLAAFRLPPGARPARVAIVGAGPVGMWIAVMLCHEHARIVDTCSGAPRIHRPPSAPTVDIFEQRRPENFGTRRITLAMSNNTQDLLNRHLVSDHGITSKHEFAPACSINLVEEVLRDNFERYVSADLGHLNFGSEIENPESLFDNGYDVVIVAGGRQSLSDSWRQPRGLDLSEHDAESALTIKFVSGSGAVRNRSWDESTLARVNGDIKIYIRPGATADQGYVWILGLPSDLNSLARSKLSGHKPLKRFSELNDTLSSCLELCSGSSPNIVEEAGEPAVVTIPGEIADTDAAPFAMACASQLENPKVIKSAMSWLSDSLCQIMNMLDESLQPVSVSPRMTTAAYWRSKDVVHVREGTSGADSQWLVLVGDAACGKPFHKGSTLNCHFHDTVSLIRGTPWSQWDPCGQPFAKYIERYRIRTGASGFRRSTHA